MGNCAIGGRVSCMVSIVNGCLTFVGASFLVYFFFWTGHCLERPVALRMEQGVGMNPCLRIQHLIGSFSCGCFSAGLNQTMLLIGHKVIIIASVRGRWAGRVGRIEFPPRSGRSVAQKRAR